MNSELLLYFPSGNTGNTLTLATESSRVQSFFLSFFQEFSWCSIRENSGLGLLVTLPWLILSKIYVFEFHIPIEERIIPVSHVLFNGMLLQRCHLSTLTIFTTLFHRKLPLLGKEGLGYFLNLISLSQL